MARMPGFSLRLSTTAPAPSPNSTQVPRSFQSRMREIHFRADHQRRCLYCPGLHEAGRRSRARRRSRCTPPARRTRRQPFMPSLACSRHAVLGKTIVGRRGRDDDQVDVFGGDARRLERARGSPASARSLDACDVGRDVALADAGARRGSTRRWCRRRAASSCVGQHLLAAGSCRCRRCANRSVDAAVAGWMLRHALRDALRHAVARLLDRALRARSRTRRRRPSRGS